jgi:hypothetical protein
MQWYGEYEQSTVNYERANCPTVYFIRSVSNLSYLRINTLYTILISCMRGIALLQQLNYSSVNLRKKPVKCYVWSIALNGAETWTLRKVDQK